MSSPEVPKALPSISHNSKLSYYDKLAQTNKEAKASVVAVGVIIVVWLVGGFGLSGIDVEIAHTPLWVVVGCGATWICAIGAAVVLARSVFVDFDLDDPTDTHE